MRLKQKLASRCYVLGIDVGGGKILAELYEIESGRLFPNKAWEKKVSTEKGLQAHIAQMTSLIKEASMNVPEQSTILGVGIGSPGRFRNGVILPGTNPSLDKIPGTGEFDGVNLQEAYASALGNHSLAPYITVNNDGNAMLAGFLDYIQHSPPDAVPLIDQNRNELTPYGLRNQHVALLGIGTGIGHAIAEFDSNGSYRFVTDGHASKLKVKVDDADWPMVQWLEKISPPGKVMCFHDEKSVRAEDLFRIPSILTLSGVGNKEQLDLSDAAMQDVIAFAGKYMARTIELIRSGQSTDVNPDNGWSADDKQTAAKTSLYLIGGGLAETDAGRELVAAASEELKARGITGVRLIQMPHENIAARAAAAMIPPESYRQLNRKAVRSH